MKAPAQKKLRRVLFALAALVVVGLLVWSELRPDGLGDGFASGNGNWNYCVLARRNIR